MTLDEVLKVKKGDKLYTVTRHNPRTGKWSDRHWLIEHTVIGIRHGVMKIQVLTKLRPDDDYEQMQRWTCGSIANRFARTPQEAIDLAMKSLDDDLKDARERVKRHEKLVRSLRQLSPKPTRTRRAA